MLAVSLDRFKQPGDVVVLSVHWGGNWEYQIDKRHRKFAHAAIKSAGVDIIHGHSSHHARGNRCSNCSRKFCCSSFISTSCSTAGPVSTWMGDCLRAGKPSRSKTSQLG